VKRWLPWTVPAAAFALVQAMVLARIATGTPMASYLGGPGAQFHSHADRLWTWSTVQEALWGQGSLLTLPLDVDGDYPPLLHLVTSVLVAPFGHSLGAATASGMLWVALLAAALGMLGARLGGPTAGAAAATGIVLLPSLQAFSVRYYYETPMTAMLWLGIALLVLHWDGSRRRVVAVGAVLALAALTKWTALVFGGLSGLGLLWMARGDRIRRTHVVIAGAVAGALSGLYGCIPVLTGGHSSFLAMFNTFEGAPPIVLASLDRWWFYPLWLVRSVLSPALTVPLVALLGVWAARSRVAAPLIIITVVGQWLWLVVSVPILDERFVLTLVPALVLGAALGFGALGETPRRVLGALTVLVGLSVCWDAHLGRSGGFPDPGSPWQIQHVRQLGMDNAWNIDGAWARGDAVGEDCSELRAALWDLVERDDIAVLGVPEQAPVLRDHYWWAFKSAERAVMSPRGEDTPGLILVRVAGEPEGGVAQRILTLGGPPPAPPGWRGVQESEVLSAPDCPTAPAVHVWEESAP